MIGPHVSFPPTIFETKAVFSVNSEQQEVSERAGSITPVIGTYGLTNYEGTFHAHGVLPHDLVILGATLDEWGDHLGVTDYGFLVTQYGRWASRLATAEHIAANPNKLITPRLAWHLAVLPLSELVQFSSDTVDMEKIAFESKRLYPAILQSNLNTKLRG